MTDVAADAVKPAHPELTPVTSSNLSGIAHHEGALFVKFNNGSVWKYPGVPPAHFEEMKTAESVGRYFNAHVKGRFEGVKIA